MVMDGRSPPPGLGTCPCQRSDRGEDRLSYVGICKDVKRIRNIVSTLGSRNGLRELICWPGGPRGEVENWKCALA
jgi:hypothetical protein